LGTKGGWGGRYVISVLATGVVLFPDRRRVVREERIAVIAVVARHSCNRLKQPLISPAAVPSSPRKQARFAAVHTEKYKWLQ